MSVRICSVEKESPAYRAGIRPGEILLSLNGHPIVDILDYQFYMMEQSVRVATRKEGVEILLVKFTNRNMKIWDWGLKPILWINTTPVKTNVCSVLWIECLRE